MFFTEKKTEENNFQLDLDDERSLKRKRSDENGKKILGNLVGDFLIDEIIIRNENGSNGTIADYEIDSGDDDGNDNMMNSQLNEDL